MLFPNLIGDSKDFKNENIDILVKMNIPIEEKLLEIERDIDKETTQR